MIIGFTGKMGVGKSTAIETIKTLCPRGGVAVVKFAQPLYDMQEFIYDRISTVHTRSECFTKDRKLLQWLGTDWGRDSISTTLWVDIWKATVAQIKAEDDGYPEITKRRIICDDVRFANEAETVKALGGVVIQIILNSAENRIDTTSGIKGHSSESGIHPSFIDHTVTNDGTKEEFETKIKELYRKINKV